VIIKKKKKLKLWPKDMGNAGYNLREKINKYYLEKGTYMP